MKDVKGKPHYNDNMENGVSSQNGYNSNDKLENDEEEEEEEGEDNDISMSADESDDDGDLMEYEADAVVVTLPLGILKRGDVEFKPALPPWKQNAINSIGFGLLNKVFLKFENVFWDIDNDYVGYASSTHGEFYLFVNLVPVSGTPVLMSLISGSFAEKLEKKTDEQIVDYAMKILQNMFANKHKSSNKKNSNKWKKIPQPTDYYVTRWKQDPFARGSYSYIAKGSNGDHYDKLSYSVKDKLYFAGEATIRKWPASVHGAYLSGIREARKIMNNHYIHNENEEYKTSPKTRRKRGKRNNTDKNKLSSQIIKAGLNELPTDTIFKPIKDQTIRMSTRKNPANKYSSKNQSSRSKSNKRSASGSRKKLQRKTNSKTSRRNSTSRVRRSHHNEDQDISSMSDTSSITSQSMSDHENQAEKDEELTCALCGGTGYLSDDIVDNNNNHKTKNKNQKLIGPFIVDNNNHNNKSYIHFGCGLWSPDILHNNQDNQWYNVISCIKRSKYIKCCYCGEYGASVHCHNNNCLSSYHPECAHTTQCWDFDRPDEGQIFFCIKHRDNILSLHINPHQTKLLSINKSLKNQLRLPRPPAIRK